MNFLTREIWGNSVQTWLLAGLITLAIYWVLRAGRGLLLRRVRKLAAKTTMHVDDFLGDLVESLRKFFLLAVALVLGARLVVLSDGAMQTLRVGFIILALLQVGFWATHLLTYVLRRRAASHEEETQSAALQTIERFARGLIWAVVLVMILDSIPGIEVSSLVATLGITGIAVAFAIQNVLSDLFAALSITFDQPFVVGDVIEVGDLIGSVEKIGLKSTRLRSLTGEQLIFSNSDLLESRIHNYKKMQRRRVVLRFGVNYQTPARQLQAIPAIVKEAVIVHENVTFDRAHFTGFGSSSLDFEVVYWIETPDYGLYMDMQQAIDLQLLQDFQEAGIEFPYPTQTIYLQGEVKNPLAKGGGLQALQDRET